MQLASIFEISARKIIYTYIISRKIVVYAKKLFQGRPMSFHKEIKNVFVQYHDY